MENYRIITDSTCDFSKEMYEQLQLTAVPLTVSYQGQEQEDRNDSSLHALYEGLRAGQMATTSAVNPQRWAEAMEPWLKQGTDLLVLAFSSALSTTYQSAVIAAQELQDKYPDRTVCVVDTRSASLGEGLLAYYACQKRDAGMPLQELYRWVEDNKLNLCHWFTVDDLMYLKRGGRVSAATALVGTMLQIKPVLHVNNEGQLINKLKARGRKASLEALAQKLKETGEGYDNSVVAISHGDCLEEAQQLADYLKSNCGVKEVLISYVGAVIGSHAGPGTVALFFMGKHR